MENSSPCYIKGIIVYVGRIYLDVAKFFESKAFSQQYGEGVCLIAVCAAAAPCPQTVSAGEP